MKGIKVVSDYKDTNFWKQFTTKGAKGSKKSALFQTTKIQTFESNSQHATPGYRQPDSCFRLQRYKLLKAIHNFEYFLAWALTVVSDYKDTNFWKQFTTLKELGLVVIMLFQTTKIQTFESNSQLCRIVQLLGYCCFRLQRYKLLKAIHNTSKKYNGANKVVSDYKDTNFWKQFTTLLSANSNATVLFQTTKIQTFESNSQRCLVLPCSQTRCFRLQRYKLLKAIHNYIHRSQYPSPVVSDYKDTNFWKQFTTKQFIRMCK